MTNEQTTIAATTSNPNHFVFELATGEKKVGLGVNADPDSDANGITILESTDTKVSFEVHATEDGWISTLNVFTNDCNYETRLDQIDGKIKVSSDRSEHTAEDKAELAELAEMAGFAESAAGVASWTDEERAAAKADVDAANASIQSQEGAN